MSTEPLNDIEIRILQLSASGYGYKEIAGPINRSEANVKWHAMRLRDKLGAKTMVQAVAIAIRKGIIK